MTLLLKIMKMLLKTLKMFMHISHIFYRYSPRDVPVPETVICVFNCASNSEDNNARPFSHSDIVLAGGLRNMC